MFLKRRINLILSLCLIALTSVGFSSWVITINSATVTGTITVDEVINSNNYDNLTMFHFDENGFLQPNPNYTITNPDGLPYIEGYTTDEMSTEYNIDLSSFSNVSSMTIDFTVKYNDSVTPTHSLFNQTYFNFTANIEGYQVDVTSQNNQSYSFSVNFGNIANQRNISFTVNYTISVKSNYATATAFHDNFFEEFKQMKLDFLSKITIN